MLSHPEATFGLGATTLTDPPRIVYGPSLGYRLWNEVTCPSRLGYRPPGSFLESRRWSLIASAEVPA